MFFRFAVAIGLVVAIALTGAVLERSNLELRRRVSQQQFRMQALRDRFAKSKVDVQRLGAPDRWLGAIETGRLSPAPAASAKARHARMPLLDWTMPPERH